MEVAVVVTTNAAAEEEVEEVIEEVIEEEAGEEAGQEDSTMTFMFSQANAPRII